MTARNEVDLLKAAAFPAMLDQAPVGVCVLDAERRVRQANAKARQLLPGIDLAPGRDFANALHRFRPADGDELAVLLQRALDTGEPSPRRRFFVLPENSGSPTCQDWELIRQLDPDGIMVVACYFSDVTVQAKAEHLLQESEKELRIAFDQAAVGMATADLEGRFQQVNHRFAELTGYAPEELAGQTFRALTHPDDLAITEREMVRLLAGEIPSYALEKRYLRKDGKSIWSLTKVTLVRDAEGRPARFVGVVEDITEARRTRTELREASIVTRHLNDVARALASELDLAKVVQIITDAGTRITRAQFGAFFYNVLDERGASYMLYALSGAPREAFAKFPMPRATAIFAPTFRGEGVVRIHDVRLDPRFGHNAPHHGMPAGHLPVVSYLAVPVISRSGEVLGGLFFGHGEPGVFTERDETVVVGVADQAAAAMDNARLYQNEQQARAAAEKASQTKDHFLATLSHELRTPLTPVLAILSNLGAEARPRSNWPEDLATMRRNIELEARLIDDLLDLTRISQGKLELHRERQTIGALIEDALNTCLNDLQAQRLVLVRDLRDVDQPLFVDSARVTQILWNLLKNSIKFTPEGGTITLRSRLVAGAGGSASAVFEVEDTGIGMDAPAIDRVFDAFEQGGRQITQRFGGLGLGLAISKAIVEAHDGAIAAFSAGPGRGSRFTVTLPRNLRDLEPELPTPVRSLSSSPGKPAVERRRKQSRILFVEDHADTARVLAAVLRRDGYFVVHAASVADALAAGAREMAGDGLDLVVSDIGLPDGSGLDVMRELSQRFQLRGIALSGFGMEADRTAARDAGFIRHITKPVDSVRLRGMIAEILRLA